MTPHPQPSLFEALSDAPEAKERQQARADLSAPDAAAYNAAPEAIEEQETFDPFSFRRYDPDYCTAWCMAERRWQNHRGKRPAPFITSKEEWERRKLEQKGQE